MTARDKAELRRLTHQFHEATVARGRCALCGYDGWSLQAHHAIGKATLKRVLLMKGAPIPPALVWDPRNGLCLCAEPAPNRCHDRHTNRFRPLPPRVLTAANWEFARELGLAWVLERDYVEEERPRPIDLKRELRELFSEPETT